MFGCILRIDRDMHLEVQQLQSEYQLIICPYLLNISRFWGHLESEVLVHSSRVH